MIENATTIRRTMWAWDELERQRILALYELDNIEQRQKNQISRCDPTQETSPRSGEPLEVIPAGGVALYQVSRIVG